MRRGLVLEHLHTGVFNTRVTTEPRTLQGHSLCVCVWLCVSVCERERAREREREREKERDRESVLAPRRACLPEVDPSYRGTALIRNGTPPWDHHKALGIVVLQ